MKEKKTKTQMILFDGETCQCFNVLDFNAKFPTMMEGDLPYRTFTGVLNNGCMVSGDIALDKAELDSNRMKQIARYNAEKDIDFLIRKKQLLEEEIKMLEDKKYLIKNKFEQLLDFSDEFLKDEAKTLKDFIEENYTDTDYDYWD